MELKDKMAAAAKIALISMGAPEDATPDVAKQYEATGSSEFKIGDNMTVTEKKMVQGARTALLAMDDIAEGTATAPVPTVAPISPYAGRPYEGFDKVVSLAKRFGGK